MTEKRPMSTIPQDRTIDALESVWASVRALVTGLGDEQWRTPSPLPGWDVRANVAHMMGTEAMLAGEAAPEPTGDDAPAHVRNDIGAFNEAWIASMAESTTTALLERFDDLTSRRLAMLRAMPADEWNAESFTPAGPDSYGRFMQIRVFDCWMHEQDIRVALGIPGHDVGPAVDVSLDEMSTAMGFVVGKKADAPSGSSVTFALTGPAQRQIHVVMNGRARVVEGVDDPATVTLTMPVVAFSRIAGGRSDAAAVRPTVLLDGDVELGRRILDNLSYTI